MFREALKNQKQYHTDSDPSVGSTKLAYPIGKLKISDNMIMKIRPTSSDYEVFHTTAKTTQLKLALLLLL